MNIIEFVWITDEKTLELITANNADIDHNKIQIFNNDNKSIEIKNIQKNENISIILKDSINFKKKYYIKYWDEVKTYAFLNKDVLNKYFYHNENLGSNLNSDGSVNFKIWSPSADAITLIIYDQKDSNHEINRYQMELGDYGIWNKNLITSDIFIESYEKYFYQYEVSAHGITNLVLDPYAKTITSHSPKNKTPPKAQIVDVNALFCEFKSPPKKNSDLLKNEGEFIGYETHIRDFSIDPDLDIPNDIKGTYLGVMKNIPHLKELGITHLQFLPIQLFYTVDESIKDFQHENIESGKINYNWGYDAYHYFIPSGWYATDTENPATRLIELKKMTEELHNNSLGIIMDVVYNHTYNKDFFEDIAPGCYIRRNERGVISNGAGAGESIESRVFMVRKLIIDSLKYFVDKFHVNGFRFDLMSFTDHQTMSEIRNALGNDIILYGEGWELTDLPKEIATMKYNLPANSSISVFNDSTRDSFTGDKNVHGFVQGSFYENPKAKASIIGGIKDYPQDYDYDHHMNVMIDLYHYNSFAESPMNTINYLSIHDGPTLWDKINLTYNSEKHTKKSILKMALVMLLTSQGKVVLEGGCEIGRSKPLSPNDPNINRALTSDLVEEDNEAIYFHENSYKSPDSTNMINWSRKNKFKDIYNYLKGVIQLKKEFSAFRLEKSNSIKNGITFVSDYIPNSKNFDLHDKNRYHDWDNIEDLTIKFVNGPETQKRFITGEIHPESSENKNPNSNKYFVSFDDHGEGEITFSQNDIKNFDMTSWADDKSLNLKLVNTEGGWDYDHQFYSSFGHNRIHPNSINKANNTATINLAIKDHTAGEGDFIPTSYIAYFIDAKIENYDCIYDSFLVIHNSDESTITIKHIELNKYSIREILIDGRSAGIEPIKETDIVIDKSSVIIPGKTSTVIGLRLHL